MCLKTSQYQQQRGTSVLYSEASASFIYLWSLLFHLPQHLMLFVLCQDDRRFFVFHPSTSCLFVFSPNKESPVWHVRKKVPRLRTSLDRFWNREWKWQDVTDRGITPDGSKLGKWVGEYLQLCALWQGWYKCTYRGMQLNVCARVCAWGIVGKKKKLAWPEVSRLVLLISIKTLLDK